MLTRVIMGNVGDHAMMEKRTFYEEVCASAVFASVPWLNKEQKRIDGVFGHADIGAGHFGSERGVGSFRSV